MWQYRCNRSKRAQQPARSPRNEVSRDSAGNSICGSGIRWMTFDIPRSSKGWSMRFFANRIRLQISPRDTPRYPLFPLSSIIVHRGCTHHFDVNTVWFGRVNRARALHRNFLIKFLAARDQSTASRGSSLLTARATEGGKWRIIRTYRWRYGWHRRLRMSRKQAPLSFGRMTS